MVLPRHPAGCGDERTINPDPAGGTGCAGGSGGDPAEVQHLSPGAPGQQLRLPAVLRVPGARAVPGCGSATSLTSCPGGHRDCRAP